ncbi:MAG: c-type cytochrome [Desulfobaccales bacterium]
MKSAVTILLVLSLGIAGSAWAQGGSADKGKAIVDAKHCALCHKEGGNLGKPMDMVVGTHDDAYLKGALTDPKKTLGPTVKMPAFKMSDADLEDVIAYLKSIKK